MYQFNSLTLKDMPFFRDETTFRLDRKGISLILGRNLDASRTATNGAGKSYFFAQIPELFIGAPTIGVKKDTVRKGSTTLQFTHNKTSYAVTRAFLPREKITIVKDGVDMEIRELSAAKEELARLIPYSEAEIFSLLYLDTRLPHPLIRGTSADRKEFFQRFFRLHGAPYMRKVIKKELDALAEAAGSLSEVRRRIKELRAEEHQPLDKLLARQERVKVKQESLQTIARNFGQLSRIQAEYVEFKPQLKLLKSLGIDSEQEAQKEQAKLKRLIESLTSQQEAWDAYVVKRERSKQIIAQREELKAKLPVVLSELSLSVALKKTSTEFQTLRDEYAAAQARTERLLSKVHAVSESRRAQMQTDLSALRERKARLQKDADTCPTCGGEYDNEHVKQKLNQTTSEIAELKSALSEADSSFESLSVKLTAAQTAEAELHPTLVKCKSTLAVLQELEGLPSSEVIRPEGDPKELAKELEETQERRRQLRNSTEAFAARDAYLALTAEQKSLLEGADPTEALLTLTSELSDLRLEIEAVRTRDLELERLTVRRDEVKALLDEKEALELLAQAFGPRNGVESLQIKAVCARLEQEVNRYARLIFPEDFTFTFDMEGEFSILAHRRYGKRLEVSDVRKLSGAESPLCSLILLIALMVFVPAKDRPSLLILDEPTATMGVDMIEAFVKFLPTLNSVIPHIVVITPRPQIPYPGAKIFTVVKKRGRSTIVEGDYTETVAPTRTPAKRKATT